MVVGYPQILKGIFEDYFGYELSHFPTDFFIETHSNSLEPGGTEKHYNSACFVDRDGNLITTYQKSFLYDTDERWADEGPGFKCLEVDGLGKVIISASL